MIKCKCYKVFTAPIGGISPTPTPPPSGTPNAIFITGADMSVGSTQGPTVGMTYNNTNLAGYDLLVFSNSFNRYLVSPSEYQVLPAGGFEEYLSSEYGVADIFLVEPNGLLP